MGVIVMSGLVPVGAIIFMLLTASPPPLPLGYLPADGRCLFIGEYPELWNVLHNGSTTPYGMCGPDQFRLPDLTAKDDVLWPRARALIKVTP